MKKLHLFVIKSYIGPFILTFFIVLFLLLMQFLWKYIDDLAGKGLEWYIIVELLTYTSASLVPMALPLAILMAAIMTFGNLGENYELTALKASGISLQRVMFPLIILTLITCYLAFLFSNHVMPYANLKMRSLLYDIRHQRPELNIKEGIFYNGIEGYSIKISDKDKKTNLLKKIMIYDHTDNAGNINVSIADSGYMKLTANEDMLMVTLYHGRSYQETQETSKKRRSRQQTYPHQRDKFDKKVFFLALDGFDFTRTDERLFKNHYQMLNLKQLEYAEDSLTGIYQNRLDNFNEGLFKTYLFRKELKTKDTLKLKKLTDTLKFDMDSLYTSLKLSEKKTAINQALVYARSTKSYIRASNNDLKNRDKYIRKHKNEWHRKFTLSFACFIFFFIGAPLGAITRRGGLGLPVVISVVFFLIYYMISISGEKFVKEGLWQPFNGMWLSSIILFPLGVFLTYKATTDSTLLNLDTYTNLFKKLIRKESQAFKFVATNVSRQDKKISDEKYILSLKSLIFKSKKCVVETDYLYSNIFRYHSLQLNENLLYNEFSNQYLEITKMLVKSRYIKIKQFKNKIFELPLFNTSSLKYQNKNLYLSIFIYVLFPAKIIQVLTGLVKIQLLKSKFSNIIVILQELIDIIEKSLLYQNFEENK